MIEWIDLLAGGRDVERVIANTVATTCVRWYGTYSPHGRFMKTNVYATRNRIDCGLALMSCNAMINAQLAYNNEMHLHEVPSIM